MAEKKQIPKKPRASKYDEKLSIDGTFEDVFKVIKKDRELRLAEKKLVEKKK